MNEQTTSAKLKNFTPLLDDLVKKHGVITAAVWGRMWRYAQAGDRKICTAAIGKIAGELDLSVRTVIRHIQVLEKSGYLLDLTPDLKNIPHTYSLTEKARIEVIVDAVTESQAEQPEQADGMTESHSTMSESHSECDTESQPAMTESHLKKGFKKQDKKQINIQEEREALLQSDDLLVGIFKVKEVAGFTPDFVTQLRAVQLMRDILNNHTDYGAEGLKEHCKRYADAWRARKTKDGKPYSILNIKWLELAAADNPLPDGAAPAQQQAQRGPNGGLYV